MGVDDELRRVGKGSVRNCNGLGGGVGWSDGAGGVLGRENGNAGVGKENAKSSEITPYFRRKQICSLVRENSLLCPNSAYRESWLKT